MGRVNPLCTTVLQYGLSVPLLQIETSDAKLWAPQNSPSVGYKRRMDSLFGFRDRTSYFYAEPHEGGSVLTKSRLLDFHDAFDAVRPTPCHLAAPCVKASAWPLPRAASAPAHRGVRLTDRCIARCR